MKRALFFVLLLVIELVSVSQNLVVNPGFEIWGKTTKPNGWVPAERCLKDSSDNISGKYTCMHSGSTTSRADLGQTITVLPGKNYMLSFYSRTIASTGSGARIWCSWKNAAGTRISDPLTDDILQPSEFMKNESWQQSTVIITAPAEAVTFYLEVRTYANSITWWDDFVFEETVTTSNQEEKLSDIYLYPNPAYQYLTIDNIHQLQHIDILDITGVKIWSADYSGEPAVTLPVSGFPGGIYIIRIKTTEELITRKFIRKAK